MSQRTIIPAVQQTVIHFSVHSLVHSYTHAFEDLSANLFTSVAQLVYMEIFNEIV